MSITTEQYDPQTCRAAWANVDPETGVGSTPYSAYSACPTMNYFQSLFVAVQVAVDSCLLSTTFTPKFYTAPLQAYQQYLGQGSTQIVPLYLAIALCFFCPTFSTKVVSEKEKKIRDGMRMMGCSSVIYYFSWLLSTALTQLPVVVLYTIALNFAKIIYQSNWFIVFITILLYIFSQTAKCVPFSHRSQRVL